MPRGRGRGGYREPNRPAATSGPGALSARTDGGPGRVPNVTASTPTPAEHYGQRTAEVNQRAGAPLPTQTGQAGGATPAQAVEPLIAGARDRLFAPTRRPGEPLTTGAAVGAGRPSPELLPQDPDMLLRAAYAVLPDNTLLRFISDFHA